MKATHQPHPRETILPQPQLHERHTHTILPSAPSQQYEVELPQQEIDTKLCRSRQIELFILRGLDCLQKDYLEWKLLEKSLGMRQKIKRDIDYNLVQTLQAFIKKYRSDAAMIPWKSKENVKGLWDSAWPREVINDLILAFASDREIANAGINGLKEFLTAKYADKINRSNLQREFTYERIQAFKKGHPSKIQVGKD